MSDFYIDMEKTQEIAYATTGVSDCIICGRDILLGTWHTMKDTVLCKECKKRLKELLYTKCELENLEKDD